MCLGLASTWLYVASRPATRLEQIAAWLRKYEPTPGVFTPGVSDRKFWEQTPELPPTTPRKGLPTDATALVDIIIEGTNQECKYQTGQWIPVINDALRRVVELPWRELHMFKREFTDLHTTAKGAALARTCYLLQDKLDPDVVSLTIDTIQNKVIDPFLADSVAYQERTLVWGGDMCPWLEMKDNWTAVCVANIVYATLAIEPDIMVRAGVIAATEDPIKDYFTSFESDGYLSSGIRYWNYGFGHLMLLGERLFKATGGKINLFNDPNILEMARFRDKWEIGRDGDNAYYPLFADNANPTSIRGNLLFLVSRRFGTSQTETKKSVWNESAPMTDLLLNPPVLYEKPTEYIEDVSLRTYFSSSGAMVARNKSDKVSLAIKGGTNSEEHNHNDIGAYTVFSGNMAVCGDVGVGAYSPALFGMGRYSYDIVSSFGHPLPVVDNRLQFNGVEARAKVLKHTFTDEIDTITYDLRGAYGVSALKKLERTVSFSRGSQSVITVEDSFEADYPIAFETAIIAPRNAQLVGQAIYMFCGDQRFIVNIKSPERPAIRFVKMHMNDEPIMRFSIGLKQKQKSGSVKYTISQDVYVGP